VLYSGVRINIKRLDEHAATSTCQPGNYESARIISAQQSSLDTDASG
jgi:hypothetical protein